MAKQKAKIGTDGPGRDGASDVPPARAAAKRKLVAKRKVKNARKGKVRAVAVPAAEAGASGGARPKGPGKAIRKKATKVALPSSDSLVSRVFEGLQGALPTIARPRKPVRPGAPLGRLERLEVAIQEVRVGGRQSLRTRKLLASGVPKMAQKVIEEAAETAIEAIRGDQTAFVQESVDLFYNLLALASEIGVPLSAIWAEMDRREVALGMSEKLPKVADG